MSQNQGFVGPVRTTAEELKPCPFCGSRKVELVKCEGAALGELRWRPECMNEDCSFYNVQYMHFATRKQAVKEWNKRALNTALQTLQRELQHSREVSQSWFEKHNALQREKEELSKYALKLDDWNDELQQRLDKAEADTKRLNWLEQEKAGLHMSGYRRRNLSFREAIDVALAAAPSPPEESNIVHGPHGTEYSL